MSGQKSSQVYKFALVIDFDVIKYYVLLSLILVFIFQDLLE
ncbi:hypothetical protein [Salmonella enterica]|nr:hypothetical protein [Salmonella enterica]